MLNKYFDIGRLNIRTQSYHPLHNTADGSAKAHPDGSSLLQAQITEHDENE